ncbi:MAG TPA: methylenetetrahydrofolate reductase [Trebonia sp.]|nr:methylenetetrahydrofolate reductase [Trebonia sp.]
MTLRDALASGRFTVTAELSPPGSPSSAPVRRAAAAIAGLVDAANVTDNPAATPKLSPLVTSSWLIDEGVEPIMQVTTRDRNLLALQSDLLGAWAVGVRNLLALSGDPLRVGKYAQLATFVGDVDSTALIRLVAMLNAGHLAAGETLSTPTGFLVGAALNPLVDGAPRIAAKVEAGARFFQTNIVYDVARFADWFAPHATSGVLGGAPVLVGVMPPRSVAALEHMHNNIPGVQVDEGTFARLAGLSGADAKAAGVEIAARVIEQVRQVPCVAGVHIMAPGWEAEAVTRLTAATAAR